MSTFSPEEKQYLALQAQFNAELASIDEQLDALHVRKNDLLAILNGSAKVEEANEVEHITFEGDPRSRVDQSLIRFVKDNPGAHRAEIIEGLWDYDADEIKRSINRVRRRGLIISEGRTTNAQWYLTEDA